MPLRCRGIWHGVWISASDAIRLKLKSATNRSYLEARFFSKHPHPATDAGRQGALGTGCLCQRRSSSRDDGCHDHERGRECRPNAQGQERSVVQCGALQSLNTRILVLNPALSTRFLRLWTLMAGRRSVREIDQGGDAASQDGAGQVRTLDGGC